MIASARHLSCAEVCGHVWSFNLAIFGDRTNNRMERPDDFLGATE
jgi:hypothetical protein